MDKSIKEYIEKYQKLLPLANSISFTDAEQRASKFLDVMATITEWRHILSENKIELQSIQSVTYSNELNKSTGKTVTENKISVEASQEYIDAREDLEKVENDISYLKAYYDVFNNAHIFYRTMAKGDNV